MWVRIEGTIVEEELGSSRKPGLLAKSHGCHIKGYLMAQYILCLGRTLCPWRPWWFMMNVELRELSPPHRGFQAYPSQPSSEQRYPGTSFSPRMIPLEGPGLITDSEEWVVQGRTAASRLKSWDFNYSSISQFWGSLMRGGGVWGWGTRRRALSGVGLLQDWRLLETWWCGGCIFFQACSFDHISG